MKRHYTAKLEPELLAAALSATGTSNISQYVRASVNQLLTPNTCKKCMFVDSRITELEDEVEELREWKRRYLDSE